MNHCATETTLPHCCHCRVDSHAPVQAHVQQLQPRCDEPHATRPTSSLTPRLVVASKPLTRLPRCVSDHNGGTTLNRAQQEQRSLPRACCLSSQR